MKDDNTTLAVPKDFADNLRDDFDGSNDLERLENWAEEHVEESYKDSITRSNLEEVLAEIDTLSEKDVKRAVRNALPSGVFE